MQEMDKQQPKATNVKYWMARLSLKNGDKQAAIAYAKEGLKLATDEKDQEYTRMNKEALQDAEKK